MKHGSLFTGIGGFDLAAEWMGWENVFQCEKDKYCQFVLRQLWPNVKKHGDIRTTDFSIYRGLIDVLSGGDPCQPHSVAGLGKGTEDYRFLWPEKFRAIREIRPPFVVNENVVGSVSNGVLDLKVDDLESIGYTCRPFNIPAEAVGALHQRERVWLIGYHADFHRNNKASRRLQTSEGGKELEAQRHNIHIPRQPVDLWITPTHPNPERQQEQHDPSVTKTQQERISGYFGFGPSPHGDISRDAIESGIIRMLDGLPEGMDYTERSKRIKALGNAIVPQVAYQIFKAIERYERG